MNAAQGPALICASIPLGCTPSFSLNGLCHQCVLPLGPLNIVSWTSHGALMEIRFFPHALNGVNWNRGKRRVTTLM